MNINDKFIILKNNRALKALKVSSGTADILKVNTDDVTEFLSFPITPTAAPDADYEIVNKKYVDDGFSANTDQKCTGIVSWGGTGNYYSLVDGTFTVLRSGVGRISGTNKITWAGAESISGLAVSTGYLIGYSATNTLIKIDIATLDNANSSIMINNWLTAYTDNVILFGVWTDGAYPIVVKEDHEYKYTTPISMGQHFRWGQTFTLGGAALSILNAVNRTIQTIGEDILSDHGISTRILDNPGVSLNPQPIFMNAVGVGQRLAPHRFTVSGITTAPTNGAVYSSNGSQYTILYTNLTGVAPNISGTIYTWMSTGTVAPLASGTLTHVSGTGDASIAYSSFLVPPVISNTYLNAGVPTQLTVGGATRYGIVAIYATKDDKQTPNTTTPTPHYFQLLSNASYNNTANAANSIGSSLAPDLTQFVIPPEFKALELTLNGFVLCDGHDAAIPDVSTNGFIAGVKTVKATLTTQFTTGSVTATTANNVSLDTTTFTSGWLTATEANVQLMADKIETSSANFPVSTSNDVGLPLVASGANTASWALSQATIDSNNSGFISWGGTGDYYSFVPSTGVFTVLRSGVGRIKGSKKTWAGGENTTLTRNKSYMIAISNTNTLVAIDWRTLYNADVKTYMDNMESAFKNNIFLFSIFYDAFSDGYSVMKQLHPYDYGSEVAAHDHFRLGHVFIGAGGLVSVLSAANRTIQTVGNAVLDDHGVLTAVADGTGVAMSTNCLYSNAGGTLSKLARRAFVVTTGTPVAGDVYQDSGDTFRVTILYFTGGVAHAYQSAGVGVPPAGTTTLTRVSGTGSTTIIYSSWTEARVIPSIYTPAGVPTPLAPTGNTNRYGLFAIYATADDFQTPSVATPLPNFICVPSATAYNSTANAISSIGTAAIPNATQFLMPPEIEALEPCLMGFVLIDGNTRAISATTSAGFVSGVRSYRNTGSGTGGAGAAAVSTAINVSTNTTNFVAADGISSVLSAADVNAQLALDTIARGRVPRYTVALSWSGGGPYTMTILGSTHLRGGDAIVRLREFISGTNYKVVTPTEIDIDETTGDVVITNASNFTGKVTIL